MVMLLPLARVLPIVGRIWASARMGQLDGWFKSWVPDSVFSAGGGRGSVEAWYTSSLDTEEFLLRLLIPMFIFLLLMLSSLLTRLIGVFWILCCLVLGFLAGFVMLILSTMLMLGCGLSWHLVLVSPGLVMERYSSRLSFEYDVHCSSVSALVYASCCSGGGSASIVC